jgi:hypothetical protein
MNTQNGEPISLDKAKKYVEAFSPIKETTKTKILPKITDVDRLDAKIVNSEKHHQSPANAFLFDAKHVMRFFIGDGPKAEYLMVFLAADDKTAEPTVVVAGVNKIDTDGDGIETFVSLPIPDPATQHPPKQVLSSFPGPEKSREKQEIFKVRHLG